MRFLPSTVTLIFLIANRAIISVAQNHLCEPDIHVSQPLLIAKSTEELYLLPALANRHGLVAGATGTGKTVTLQVMAEAFSRIGVPVFAADVKGDLSGIAKPGTESPKLKVRVDRMRLEDFRFEGSPVTFWDVFGEQGHPIRATVSEMGPLLLSRILNLNDTQSGVLTLTFKIADDNGLLLLDLKDLQAMLQFVGKGAKQFQTQYGNISAASIGAIQRGLVTLSGQGGDLFLGRTGTEHRRPAANRRQRAWRGESAGGG